MYFSVVISFWRFGGGDFFFPLSFICLSLLLVEWEAHYDRLGRATAVATAHRAASSEIEIQDHTHLPLCMLAHALNMATLSHRLAGAFILHSIAPVHIIDVIVE